MSFSLENDQCVIFASEISSYNFAPFDYDEYYGIKPGFANIRDVLRRNELIWLDELADYHSVLSERMFQRSKWWWTAHSSRLDARPFAPGINLIKSLFFARATLIWLEQNVDVKELTILSAPREMISYLIDMAPELNVNVSDSINAVAKPRLALWQRSKMILKEALAVTWFHYRKPKSNTKCKNLVLYQPVYGLDLKESFEFYYTSLFDDLIPENIQMTAVGRIVSSPTETKYKSLLVFNQLTLRDIIVGFFEVIALLRIIERESLEKNVCSLKEINCTIFWRDYLQEVQADINLLHCNYGYKGLRSLLRSIKVSRVVLPYEEKGMERAIMCACQKEGVETIGFTPHPQHRLAVSMKDRINSSCPKPDSYAFCGKIYEKFYKDWGNKKSQKMEVWGSQKSLRKNFLYSRAVNNPPTILLTISHPEELRIFFSWFRVLPIIAEIAKFRLRLYPAIEENFAAQELAVFQNHFPQVKILSSTLIERIEQIDFIAFCATSAGPEVINYGKIGIFLDLTDSFFINPCTDKLDDMLPCDNPRSFFNRIQKLISMTEKDLAMLHERQTKTTTEIFGPIAKDLILKRFS